MKIFFYILLHSCTLHMIDPQFNFQKLPEKIPLDFPKKTDSKQNDQEGHLNDLQKDKRVNLTNLSNSYLLNSPKPNKFAELPCYKEKMDEIRKLEKFEPLEKVGIAEAWLRAEMAVFFAENIFEHISNLESRISEQDRLILNRDLVNAKCASESIKLLMGIPIEELKTVDKELAQFFIYDVESETKTQ